MSQEEEFKALLQIAPYDLKIVRYICSTIEQALKDHPEWATHLLKKKSVWKQRWSQRAKGY